MLPFSLFVTEGKLLQIQQISLISLETSVKQKENRKAKALRCPLNFVVTTV